MGPTASATATPSTSGITFDVYKEQWLLDVTANKPSTVELGRRFANKLLCQWLDIESASDDLVFCDGSGDGGIDIAYLHRGEGQTPDADGRVEGHVWYLVQSKYGSAFAGTPTLLAEGQKVIDTLDGRRSRLSSLAEGVLDKLNTFRKNASEYDHVTLVYATVDPLTDAEKRALNDVQAMGRARLGTLFGVETISVETIYRRNEERAIASGPAIKVSLHANLHASSSDLLVGSVPLLDMYEFLKTYKAKAGDLDELYEKNVRQFLGTRGKVNKAIQETLRSSPERFGLFNNGVTIVVSDFKLVDHTVELSDPYVVNGCQTTRSIWEVFQRRLEAGGTGEESPELKVWKANAGRGAVIAKIVKVGSAGDDLLREITRFTNSQTAVREKDFIALNQDFNTWARQMADQYGVYLEIQRGGWDSQKARQSQDPNAPQFKTSVNAFDLLKVYAAGWLREAGTAFGRNAAFAPGGTIFKAVITAPSDDPFGLDDLYAAQRLFAAAEGFDFGRGSEKVSRRQTRFLFYSIAIDLLRDVLIKGGQTGTPKEITHALLRLFEAPDQEPVTELLDTAIKTVDDYLTQGADDSVFDEPAYKGSMNYNLNAYLKWDRIGKTDEDSPCLRSLLSGYKKFMGKSMGGQPSLRDRMLAIFKT